MRAQVKTMKERMKHTTVEKIDEQVISSVEGVVAHMSILSSLPSSHNIQVQRLEAMLVSSSVSLTEEKQVLEQIKQLKVRACTHRFASRLTSRLETLSPSSQASRSSVAEYNQRLTKLTQDDAVRDAVFQRIKDADERLTKLKVCVTPCV